MQHRPRADAPRRDEHLGEDAFLGRDGRPRHERRPHDLVVEQREEVEPVDLLRAEQREHLRRPRVIRPHGVARGDPPLDVLEAGNGAHPDAHALILSYDRAR